MAKRKVIKSWVDPVLQQLAQQGIGQRNQALDNLLAQISGPSFENLYEAPAVSQAASQYRATRQANRSQLAARGLLETGANPASQRGLEELYAGQVLNAVTGGAQQETERKQSLISALLGVTDDDLKFLESLNRGALATQQAQYGAGLDKLAKGLAISGGITNLGIAAGGALLGGSAGGGLSGAVAGSGLTKGTQPYYGGQPGGMASYGGGYSPTSQYSTTLPVGAGTGYGQDARTQSLISNLGLTLAERY